MIEIGKPKLWVRAAVRCAILFLFVAGGCNGNRAEEEAVRIGTSSFGSTYHSVATGIGEVVRAHTDVNMAVEPMGGSLPNMHGLKDGNLEFAVTNAFGAFAAYHGDPPFSEPVALRLVMQGHATHRWLVVRGKPAISAAEDLRGSTIIARRPALPEMAVIMDAFMKVYGLDADDIKLVETVNTRQAYNLLRGGSVDGALLPFSVSQVLEESMAQNELEFFYGTRQERDKILDLLPPVLWGETIPAGTLEGQERDLHLIGMNTFLVARASVSNEVVYKVLKALIEHHDEFASYHHVIQSWTLDQSLSKPALPFHPGAIEYFKERGVWTSELEQNQSELVSQ